MYPVNGQRRLGFKVRFCGGVYTAASWKVCKVFRFKDEVAVCLLLKRNTSRLHAFLGITIPTCWTLFKSDQSPLYEPLIRGGHWFWSWRTLDLNFDRVRNVILQKVALYRDNDVEYRRNCKLCAS